MSEFVKVSTPNGVTYYLKKWDINRIIQHPEGHAVIYLDQGNKDDLAVATDLTAEEIIALMDDMEKAEDEKCEKRRSSRDERVKEAVLESLKTGGPLPKTEGVDIEELLGE